MRMEFLRWKRLFLAEECIWRLQNYQETFYDQLRSNREAILTIPQDYSGDGVFIWGMGLRGRHLEQFLKDEGIAVNSICDITDENLNSSTQYGNRIFSCEKVLNGAKVILASVNGAYEYLKDSGFEGTVINMQNYMSHA